MIPAPALSLAALCALTVPSLAAPADPNSKSRRQCTTFDLEIPVTAENSIYDIPRVDNNIDAVDFIWDLQRWTAPSIADRIRGVERVQDTFTINAQLCVPKDSVSDGKVLQIATHGFGFEKTYWDSEFQPEKYSYVDAALNEGYSILTYDRLGVGKSSKPDAYKVVQAPVQVEILKEITLRARAGTLFSSSSSVSASASVSTSNVNTTTSSISSHHFNIPTFEKIILVGHSLGSAITIGVLSKYPSIADAAIPTGLILAGKFGGTGQDAFGLEYAESNDKRRFRGRGSGYLVQGTQGAVNQIFFKKGFFDTRALEYASMNKETGTVGEFLSLGGVLDGDLSGYKGPVLFALGEYDFATCAGNCTDSYDLAAIEDSFKGAANVSVHIQPGSGHGLTLHEDAKGHYQAIFDYLRERL
ncbi:Alpha/Beta hydrolase protein [Aspergillus crustosus]